MIVITSINPELAIFERDDEGSSESRLALILTGTDDQQYQLTLEGRALRELATLFRGIQERFPGALNE